ncbi:MAG: hypothetical protein ABEJ68_07235 [Halobacteriaceae archaeon]
MTGPAETLATRLSREDPVTLAVGTAYATGAAGVATGLLGGPHGASSATVALLATSFLALLYASLTVVARRA